MSAQILASLTATDHALFRRLALGGPSARRSRRVWTAITNAGGFTTSVLAALLPLAAGGRWRALGVLATVTLAGSHLIVQLVKRTVRRARPSNGVGHAAIAAEPDAFSLPSGHSAAAMSVAFAWAVSFPALAPLFLALAMLVGVSRVRLGVHFPGDVLVGQLLAIATGLVALHL